MDHPGGAEERGDPLHHRRRRGHRTLLQDRQGGDGAEGRQRQEDVAQQGHRASLLHLPRQGGGGEGGGGGGPPGGAAWGHRPSAGPHDRLEPAWPVLADRGAGGERGEPAEPLASRQPDRGDVPRGDGSRAHPRPGQPVRPEPGVLHDGVPASPQDPCPEDQLRG